MTIVTTEDRIVMIKGVQKSRSSLSLSLATDPTLKNTVGPCLHNIRSFDGKCKFA